MIAREFLLLIRLSLCEIKGSHHLIYEYLIITIMHRQLVLFETYAYTKYLQLQHYFSKTASIKNAVSAQNKENHKRDKQFYRYPIQLYNVLLGGNSFCTFFFAPCYGLSGIIRFWHSCKSQNVLKIDSYEHGGGVFNCLRARDSI